MISSIIQNTPKRLSEIFPSAINVPNDYDVSIVGMSLDSRTIEKNHLFVARQGYNLDGRKFIEDAIASGASAVLKEQDDDQSFVLHETGCPIFSCADMPQVLGELALNFYKIDESNVRLIGVTGTNGKTSITQYIAQALEALGFKAAVLGTNGNGFMSALTMSGMTTQDVLSLHKHIADLARQGAEFVCLEVSSHSLDQQRIAGLSFETAVFSNLSQDHLDYHGDMETYLSCKERLFHTPGLKNAVINLDEGGRTISGSLGEHLSVFTISSDDADIGQYSWEYKNKKLSLSFVFQDEQLNIENSHLIGGFNAQNLLLSFLTLKSLGVDSLQACSVLSDVKPAAGRMQKVPSAGLGLPQVFVDFAHTPDALEKSLKAANSLDAKRTIALFGCGGNKDKEKRPMMARAAESNADIVVLTSDNPRNEDPQAIIEDALKGLEVYPSDKVFVEAERKTAIELSIELANAGDVVVLAGKGHETTQELKDKTIAFSDLEVAKEILAAKLEQQGGLQ